MSEIMNNWITTIKTVFSKQGLTETDHAQLTKTLTQLWEATCLQIARQEQHKHALEETTLMDNVNFKKCLCFMLFLTRFLEIDIPVTPVFFIFGAISLFTYHYSNDKRVVSKDQLPPQLNSAAFTWLIKNQFKGDAKNALNYLSTKTTRYCDATLDADKTDSFLSSLLICIFSGLANKIEKPFSSFGGMMLFAFCGYAERMTLSRATVCDVSHPLQIVFDDMTKALKDAEKKPLLWKSDPCMRLQNAPQSLNPFGQHVD